MNYHLKPNSETQNFDPCRFQNRIFCPKFLDLYTSIYGTLTFLPSSFKISVCFVKE